MAMTENTWELYSSKAGWAAVNRRLDAAYATAEKKMLAHIKKFPDEVSQAVETAQVKMRTVLNKYAEFGADDSEGHNHLADLLQRSLRNNGFPCAYVYRFDGVELGD